MILSILRYFRGLPVHHRWTIFITILLPVIWPLVIAYIARDLVLQAVLHVAVFLVWSVIAVVALASTLKKDRSEAEQLVAQQGEALSDRISGLRGEHEDSRADLWQQVADLEEALRSTLKEELGVVLRPPRVSLRAKVVAGSPRVSATLTVVGGSKLARLRQRLRRATRWFWKVVYGSQEVS